LIYKQYVTIKQQKIFDQLIEQGYFLLFKVNKADMFEYSMKIREVLQDVFSYMPEVLDYHLKRLNDRSTIEIQLC
jgi:hypothetical protein